jgi:hypothetical protein
MKIIRRSHKKIASFVLLFSVFFMSVSEAHAAWDVFFIDALLTTTYQVVAAVGVFILGFIVGVQFVKLTISWVRGVTRG